MLKLPTVCRDFAVTVFHGPARPVARSALGVQFRASDDPPRARLFNVVAFATLTESQRQAFTADPEPHAREAVTLRAYRGNALPPMQGSTTPRGEAFVVDRRGPPVDERVDEGAWARADCGAVHPSRALPESTRAHARVLLPRGIHPSPSILATMRAHGRTHVAKGLVPSPCLPASMRPHGRSRQAERWGRVPVWLCP
jgi:hypothetical protein